MQEAFPEQERHRAGPNAASHQGAQPDSLYDFLDGVLSDEDKTRRLGYLMRQAALVTAIVLVAVASAGYIWIYKASMPVKVGVGGGSTVLIILGTLARMSRTTQRGRASRGTGSAPRPPRSHQQLENGTNGKISRANGPDGQHPSNSDPHEDLDAASQS